MKSLCIFQLQSCQGQLPLARSSHPSRLSDTGFRPSGILNPRLTVRRKSEVFITDKRRVRFQRIRACCLIHKGQDKAKALRRATAYEVVTSPCNAGSRSRLHASSSCWWFGATPQRRKHHTCAAQSSCRRAPCLQRQVPHHTARTSRVTRRHFSTQISQIRTTTHQSAISVRATAESETATTKDSPNAPQTPPLPDFEDFVAAAREKGVNLELGTLGPVFWIEAKVAADGVAGPPGKLLGRVDGFILPWLGGNLLHLDSLRMARIESEKVRSIFGFALILGGAMLRHGYDRGCKKAELLAINDTDEYHRKLVNYYGRLGFKAVHEVTGGLRDVPHMLVWGGLGTRMDADIESILRKWSKRFVRGASGGPDSRT